MMDSLRRRIVADFEKGAGRHDDPRVYSGPPGDRGLIGPGSVSWEINAELASQAVIGRMGGADWVPASVAELDDYVETMLPKLSVTAQTREFIDFLMTSPFFPGLPDALDRQLHRFAIYARMSRAPKWAQELVGFDRPSSLTRSLIEPALRLDARRLRWAFGTPRYAQLAQKRAAGATMREVAAP